MLHLIRHRWKIFLTLFLTGAAVLALLTSGRPVASQEPAESAWTVRCQEQDSGRCEIFQRLIVQETGQRVAEFAIGFPGDKESARGVMVLPLGILLPAGVQMQIDDHAPFKFQVRFCTGDGCFAYLNLNEAVLSMMRKGGAATVTFKTLEGRDMKVTLSLTGFTKSLEKIS